jgi:hypothetical protein
MVLNFPNCGKEIYPRFFQSVNGLFGCKKISRLSSLKRPCDWFPEGTKTFEFMPICNVGAMAFNGPNEYIDQLDVILCATFNLPLEVR